MRKIAAGVILMCLVLMACKHPTTYKEVQSKKGLFTLQVPTYMSVTNDIFPGISEVEYQNDSIPLYIVAFDTSRNGLNETSLRAYYDSAEAHPTIDSAVLEQPKFLMINGDSAFTSKLTGSVNGVKFVYRIETLATPQRFFYILVWTKANKEKELEEVIEKILNSFHDINHTKV
ncbi:MAG TPA: hypothetical protein VN922_20325 [Bacteroidia bacterium]|nr:hypothetical protein [Bacteroidia bacterium]